MDPSFEQRVRERAYEIWVAAGMADGMAIEHWMSAQHALIAEAAGAPAKAADKTAKSKAAKATASAKSAATAKSASKAAKPSRASASLAKAEPHHTSQSA